MDSFASFLAVPLAVLAAILGRVGRSGDSRCPGPVGLVAILGGVAAMLTAAGAVHAEATIAWLTVSLPLAGALFWSGCVLARTPEVPPGDAWPWFAAAILTALLAAATRLRFLDAQFLFLAGIALHWWRSSRRPRVAPHHARDLAGELAGPASALVAAAAGIAVGRLDPGRSVFAAELAAALVMLIVLSGIGTRPAQSDPDSLPSLPTGRVGDSAVTFLSALTLGLGGAALVHVVRQVRLELARSAGGLSAFDTLVVIAEALRTDPYFPGLRVLADDAWIAGAAAIAVLWMSVISRRAARIVHRILAAAFVAGAGVILIRGVRG
jgi:hypothetical protein